MKRRLQLALALATLLSGALIAPLAGATAASSYRISVMVPASLANNLPLLRLHFSAPTKARSLPPLRTRPALNVKWQQIGPTTVQAVAISALAP